MALVEPIIRPPSEAGSFLLQVTVGCSANSCNFCGAYLNKPFKVKDFDEICADIEEQASFYPDTRRVFLLDGDALSLSNDQLIPVLDKLKSAFPLLTKVSAYANGFNISKRTDSELKQLYDRKLKLIYMGLESGSQNVLNYCTKKATVEEMVKSVQRCEKVKIRSSVIVLLGLGGKKYSKEHVEKTVLALNEMQPRYLSFLSLMVIPGTVLQKQIKAGDFVELNSNELLQESYDIISGLNLKKTIFRSNHASNYLSLEGRFPQDKQRLLEELKMAISGKSFLRPEFLRGL